jgi:S1-C subfamily serine protease
VTGVAVGSMADKAGIRRNDLILKINGKIVNDSADCLMAKDSSGGPVSVDILRSGQVRTVFLQNIQLR